MALHSTRLPEEMKTVNFSLQIGSWVCDWCVASRPASQLTDSLKNALALTLLLRKLHTLGKRQQQNFAIAWDRGCVAHVCADWDYPASKSGLALRLCRCMGSVQTYACFPSLDLRLCQTFQWKSDSQLTPQLRFDLSWSLRWVFRELLSSTQAHRVLSCNSHSTDLSSACQPGIRCSFDSADRLLDLNWWSFVTFDSFQFASSWLRSWTVTQLHREAPICLVPLAYWWCRYQSDSLL